jgi:hypothetical protein
MTDNNIAPICTYLDRIAPDHAVACMVNATNRNRGLCNNRAYALWAAKHQKVIV